jgi:hypothetical protein
MHSVIHNHWERLQRLEFLNRRYELKNFLAQDNGFGSVLQIKFGEPLDRAAGMPSDPVMMVQMRVIDRVTGMPTTIRMMEWISEHFVFGEMFDQSRIDQQVRSLLHRALTHELDECLMVDGKRKFDPHADEPTTLSRTPTNSP